MCLIKLTCYEAGHLSGVVVIGHSLASCTHLHLHGVEGQQLSVVVPELVVDSEQATITTEVTKTQCKLLLGAVHLPQVQERCQGVDLLSPGGLATKIIRRVSRSTSRGRSKGREAAVRAGRQAGVVTRDLFADRKVENETRKGGNNILWL